MRKLVTSRPLPWLHVDVQPTPESPDQGDSHQGQQPGYPQPQTGYPPAYPQAGNQPGYPQQAAPAPDAPQQGYPQQGFPQQGAAGQGAPGQGVAGYSMGPMPGEPSGFGLNKARLPVDSALRLVIILMFVNLALSLITTVITLFLHNSVIDYQLAHTHIPPGETDLIRQTLQTALWTKLASSVLVSGLYIWRAFALRRGSRGAYLRLFYIAIIGILGIAYLIFSGQYPVWMRVEQVLQALVLVALLVAVSRPQVRNRFAKQARPNY
ncbi:MAG TPA: hypothetical protein VHX38_15015 [Pseudonocardiaceae bacterium]|jgi:hypothetical protein|nr:hypothetical protein [Pseudonocardiaceae bacterium]